MRTCILLAALISFVTIAVAQPTPVAVEEEPHHHVLFRNDFVIVIRATLQVGESTLYHTHSHDSAEIEFVSSTTTEQFLGKDEGPAESVHSGDVSVGSVKEAITHRVRNVGNGPMDVFHVEFLQPPSGLSSKAAGPIAAENASARVYNWIIAQGASTPMHRHERPYLVVAATPMHLKMTAPDGRSLSEQVKAGDFHWVDANVTHALANDGGTQGQIVEIELK